ncbi:hypothetical protein Pr1d_33680 [Bythopirellula goksoeyrii]|uniref:Uncharacterized protein n=1 Tax=Bythopirellula goksoeyrii TaxID=1400387 RepID=A0A5B9QE22_9BACT|nr:hypothetical protein Pr1d_33680 [Bythopirellula goksoeyrii]
MPAFCKQSNYSQASMEDSEKRWCPDCGYHLERLRNETPDVKEFYCNKCPQHWREQGTGEKRQLVKGGYP